MKNRDRHNVVIARRKLIPEILDIQKSIEKSSPLEMRIDISIDSKGIEKIAIEIWDRPWDAPGSKLRHRSRKLKLQEYLTSGAANTINRAKAALQKSEAENLYKKMLSSVERSDAANEPDDAWTSI